MHRQASIDDVREDFGDSDDDMDVSSCAETGSATPGRVMVRPATDRDFCRFFCFHAAFGGAVVVHVVLDDPFGARESLHRLFLRPSEGAKTPWLLLAPPVAEDPVRWCSVPCRCDRILIRQTVASSGGATFIHFCPFVLTWQLMSSRWFLRRRRMHFTDQFAFVRERGCHTNSNSNLESRRWWCRWLEQLSK